MLPTNFLLFTGEDASHEGSKGYNLKLALTHPDDIYKNLALLGSHWRIKVKFKAPRMLHLPRSGCQEVTEHTFPGFFESNKGNLCAAFRRPMRTGRVVDWVGFIESYELVDDTPKTYEFKSYESFARHFDKRFITEAEIHRLYDGTSGQHGGKYNRRDFHPIGPKGRRVLRDFLRRFVGSVEATTPGSVYEERKNTDGSSYYYLSVSEQAYSASGRDIRIEHRIGIPYVWYSSEYSGCGNGRYGLLATEKTFLWLEDD